MPLQPFALFGKFDVMQITVASIQSVINSINTAMPELEQTLNAADAKLGDGDTGSMLARLFYAFSKVDLETEVYFGSAIKSLALAGSASTGSSLGTLIVVGLMSVAKGTKNNKHVDLSDLLAELANACKAMSSRGGANLGDKTVLDVIHAVAQASLSNINDTEACLRINEVCQETLDKFKGQPCKIGRARMFSQESKISDDPGMLAFTHLVEIVTRDAMS